MATQPHRDSRGRCGIQFIPVRAARNGVHTGARVAAADLKAVAVIATLLVIECVRAIAGYPALLGVAVEITPGQRRQSRGRRGWLVYRDI